MNLWKLLTQARTDEPGTRVISPSSSGPGVSEGAAPADDVDAALDTAFAWLTKATSAEAAPLDLQAARHQLEARLAAQGPTAVPIARRTDGRDRRTYRLRHRWPAIALTAIAVACVVYLLAGTSAVRPTPVKLQEVSFDRSLWNLDRIADAPTGNATAEMTNWKGK